MIVSECILMWSSAEWASIEQTINWEFSDQTGIEQRKDRKETHKKTKWEKTWGKWRGMRNGEKYGKRVDNGKRMNDNEEKGRGRGKRNMKRIITVKQGRGRRKQINNRGNTALDDKRGIHTCGNKRDTNLGFCIAIEILRFLQVWT